MPKPIRRRKGYELAGHGYPGTGAPRKIDDRLLPDVSPLHVMASSQWHKIRSVDPVGLAMPPKPVVSHGVV